MKVSVRCVFDRLYQEDWLEQVTRSIELEYSFALLGTSCKNGKRYRDDNP